MRLFAQAYEQTPDNLGGFALGYGPNFYKSCNFTPLGAHHYHMIIRYIEWDWTKPM